MNLGLVISRRSFFPQYIATFTSTWIEISINLISYTNAPAATAAGGGCGGCRVSIASQPGVIGYYFRIEMYDKKIIIKKCFMNDMRHKNAKIVSMIW